MAIKVLFIKRKNLSTGIFVLYFQTAKQLIIIINHVKKYQCYVVFLNRKRKNISSLRCFSGPHDGCEDEESRAGCSRTKRPCPVQHTSAQILKNALIL